MLQIVSDIPEVEFQGAGDCLNVPVTIMKIDISWAFRIYSRGKKMKKVIFQQDTRFYPFKRKIKYIN